MTHLKQCILCSSRGQFNKVKVSYDYVKGIRYVTWYNFKLLFKNMPAIPQISKYHHFLMNHNAPGSVAVKEFCDSDITTISVFNGEFVLPKMDLLDNFTIPLKGLSVERPLYLHKEVLPLFVDLEKGLLTCPDVSH